MATSVGITVPKLLPITGTFAPAFAAYFVVLAYRVSAARVNSEVFIGDKSSAAANPTAEPDKLQVVERGHGNFAEHVPLALFLGAVVEMNGGNRKVLAGGYGALLLARILHVEFGLNGENATGPGRPIGHFSTLGFVFGMAGYAAYLVKGYWGL